MKPLGKFIFPLALVSASAMAAGPSLYEIGTDDVGLAAAGMAARAQDASVLAINPAGLSHVKGKSFTGGAQLLVGDNDYTRDTGQTADNVVGALPTVSAFYSQQLDDKWTVGLGTYGNYGSGVDFGDALNVGNKATVLNKATLMSLIIAPSASYRFNEHWSVGAALDINYGILKLERNGIDGGKLKSDDHDFAFSGKVGVLYEYSDDTRFGLSYLSETDFDLDAKDLSDYGSLGLNSVVKTPQQVMFSAFHQLNASFAIMGNIGWQDWSRYSDSEINANANIKGNNVSSSGSSGDSLLQDTYHLALGVQYLINQDWLWNMGVAFDSSFYRNQDNTSLTVPSGDAWRIGTGVKYQLDETQSIGLAFEYVPIEDSYVQGLVSGSYDSALYFLMMNYSWQSI
ncbi:long-chain fatty acid transporter [Vibrio sp. S11_S32]|nr:long-chain fatty acid transporter [Vibrio sp. S11_S32]